MVSFKLNLVPKFSYARIGFRINMHLKLILEENNQKCNHDSSLENLKYIVVLHDTKLVC